MERGSKCMIFFACLHFAIRNSLYSNIILKPKQAICLEKLFFGSDVLAVLPTGYGKSLIYQILPLLLYCKECSTTKSHQTRWASLATLKGGLEHNMEIDLLQEVMNRELKKGIKGMGANKTPKSIERLSRAAGGTMALVKNLDLALGIKSKSSHQVVNNENFETLSENIWGFASNIFLIDMQILHFCF